MDQPTAKEFGILIGRVDAIGEQIAEMRQANTAEHAAVIARLDALRRDLDAKASGEWVREIDRRTDSLEKTRDEGSGVARLVLAAQGTVAAGTTVAAFLIGRGGL